MLGAAAGAPHALVWASPADTTEVAATATTTTDLRREPNIDCLFLLADDGVR